MHIPDGFVSEQINTASAVVSTGVVGYALWRVARDFKTKSADIMTFAAVSAFIFAAQMLNFAIGGGTSGHFLGAVFAAAMLGPWAACLSLALVLSVQGVFFADGGISALGTNVMNMGIIGGIAGYALYAKALRHMPKVAALAVASWSSIVLASAACALELAASGTSPLSTAFPAMVGTHALIGVGEVLITVAALKTFEFLAAKREGGLAIAGVVLSVALATFASPLASSSPDGLERVAEDYGFISAASEEKVVWTQSLFPDYQMPSVESEALSTGLAGLVGTLMVFGFAAAPARLFRRTRG